MSVDTKGFVLTEEKDVFKICHDIYDALCLEMGNKSKGDKNEYIAFDDRRFVLPDFKISNVVNMVYADFLWNKESRKLHIRFDCDSDGTECGMLDGKKIIFSLGYWGSSVEIMKIVLGAMKQYGKVYLIKNDCADYDINKCEI